MSAQVLYSSRQALSAWTAPIASELDVVERTLEVAVGTDVTAACELSTRLLSAGGKRVRPGLVLLSALAVNASADRERAVNLAAALELIHMASLVHDDVVDGRRERRGAPTANAEWGNKISVLGGDYLLSRAFSLIAADGDRDVMRAISHAAVRMSEGEVLQALCEGSLAMWEKNYYRIIRDKTAVLIGSCCECGAIIAGATEQVRRALADYGLQLGLAFQIADDILDITGDPAITGKRTCADLVRGRFTLPVLDAARRLSEQAKPAFLAALDRAPLDAASAEQAAGIILGTEAIETSRQAAGARAENARQQLQSVPDSVFASALSALTAFVTTREN